MFKVCIISCGMIANEAHIPAYNQFPNDYKIVGVCDVNKKSAEDTAKRYNIANYYTDAQKMLENEKPDVVSLCVPNYLHKEYTLMALNNGANVICEKPLAFKYSDAVEMFECAEKNNKILMACQSMRFTPDRLAAKKYIDENDIGHIHYGELSRTRRRGIPTWGKFHIKEISCGGAFIDIGVHMLDALLWLMGNPKVKSVNASMSMNYQYEIGSLIGSGALSGNVDNVRKFNPDEMDVEDFSCGLITFENGAKISFKVAWALNAPESADIKLVGLKEGIYLPECKIYFGENNEKTLDTEKQLYDVPFPGHIYIMDNLRKVLKGEAKLIIKPEETINVSQIIELVYKSAELKREVFANE
ncbi:MAG: Gfo/Idh/MocA family oxidoreductase [Ruminococcaceae bacterium]|nr:Gfo/Idh/MocA family oxidoreductase [Oscillospiraceae bacterium]